MTPEDDPQLEALARLKSDAPAGTVQRLKKRLRVARFGKDMVGKNAWAAWTVLDAFLRILFRSAGAKK